MKSKSLYQLVVLTRTMVAFDITFKTLLNCFVEGLEEYTFDEGTAGQSF